MKLELTLDNLDEGIAFLEDLQDKIIDFTEFLAYDVSAEIPYPHEVSKDGNVTTITSTKKGIAFEEYGSGFYADRRMIGNIPSYPGVWSKDHKKTFQKWKGTIKGYRYNKNPKHKLDRVIMNLTYNTGTKAEVFFR